MKIMIHQARCCGAGQCVRLAPAVFEQCDEDGVVMLLEPEPAEHHHDDVRMAAALCPSAAIELRD